MQNFILYRIIYDNRHHNFAFWPKFLTKIEFSDLGELFFDKKSQKNKLKIEFF